MVYKTNKLPKLDQSNIPNPSKTNIYWFHDCFSDLSQMANDCHYSGSYGLSWIYELEEVITCNESLLLGQQSVPHRNVLALGAVSCRGDKTARAQEHKVTGQLVVTQVRLQPNILSYNWNHLKKPLQFSIK